MEMASVHSSSGLFFLSLVLCLYASIVPTSALTSSSLFVTHISNSKPRPCPSHQHERILMATTSDAASNLLYQDQQEAMLRRSLVEEELLKPQTSLLQAPRPVSLKAKARRSTRSGTGFAASNRKSSTSSTINRLTAQHAKIVKKDGVVLLENVLSSATADRLRAYVLEQQQLAQTSTKEDPSKARSFYGVEQARANRCDLQLSLLKGGFKADNDDFGATTAEPHVLADALQELLGEQEGSTAPLLDLYNALVTQQGEFYELAAVITHPGSPRQMIHPDLPFQETAPLYVVFLALQDVTTDMGPTSFLLRTHTASHNAQFTSGNMQVKNDQLSNADCRLSCLRKGDCVVFDAQILHCGNANVAKESSQARALLNFSFRNPKVEGSLGYEGSIRPGYANAMSLADISDALRAYQKGDTDPFQKYGSGLL